MYPDRWLRQLVQHDATQRNVKPGSEIINLQSGLSFIKYFRLKVAYNENFYSINYFLSLNYLFIISLFL
jgi:hypothetical protein